MLLLQLASPQLRPRSGLPAAMCARLCAGSGLRSVRDSAGFVRSADARGTVHAAATMVMV